MSRAAQQSALPSAAALYVVAKLDRAAGAQLVKFRLGADAEPAALWSQPLDKKRGHLYRLDGDRGDRNSCRRYDLDMKNPLPLEGTDHTNLGGVDAQGNVYVAQSAATE